MHWRIKEALGPISNSGPYRYAILITIESGFIVSVAMVSTVFRILAGSDNSCAPQIICVVLEATGNDGELVVLDMLGPIFVRPCYSTAF